MADHGCCCGKRKGRCAVVVGVKQRNKKHGQSKNAVVVAPSVDWVNFAILAERCMNLQRGDLIDQGELNSADFEMMLLK